MFSGLTMSNKITPLVEGGLLAAITAILGLVATYLPIVGIVVEFFCPIPIVILTVRQGLKFGAAAVVASFLLTLIFTGPALAIRLVLTFSLCGLVLGQCLRLKLSAVKCFVPTFIMACAAQIVMLIMFMAIMGVDLIGENMQIIRDSFNDAFKVYEEMGVDPQLINQSKEMVEPVARLIGLLTPIILFCVALINTAGSYALTKWIFRKLHMKFAEPLPPFTQWRFPIGFVYLAAFSGLAVYWGERLSEGGLYFIATNLFFIAGIIGLIQGLSVLTFLADKYKISKLVRRIIFVILILNFFLLQVVAFAGLFDIIFNYRKNLR